MKNMGRLGNLVRPQCHKNEINVKKNTIFDLFFSDHVWKENEIRFETKTCGAHT